MSFPVTGTFSYLEFWDSRPPHAFLSKLIPGCLVLLDDDEISIICSRFNSSITITFDMGDGWIVIIFVQ